MTKEKYDYILPGVNGAVTNYTTDNNSLIIIGANGAGKSRLGVWVEKHQMDDVHRISAQRSLKFGEYIQQKSYEQATKLLMYGIELNGVSDHDYRWKASLGQGGSYISSVLEDYEHVLTALLAKRNIQQEQYIQECKELEKKGEKHNVVPELVTDKLEKIWKSVFPHRNINIRDGKVIASIAKDGKPHDYKGSEMSDGERVALYLIAQALVIPENKTIIVDEPEIHLHRSIMNRLWTAIEQERQDCFFIYITHDTQFAANHREAKKIWVKNFDGINWEWEEVQSGELPEQLLLDILGNRKPVIFVEGTVNSYDTKLYSEIYKDYYVVPCGGCSSVIAWTKAMNNTSQLHNLECYGIIDRDYRTDHEIEKYKESKIYVLEVAEVENLFLIPELLEFINEKMGYQDKSQVELVKKYIIETRFSSELNKQICESVVAELKYRLTAAELSKKDEDGVKEALNALRETISYDAISIEHEKKFKEVLYSNDYKSVLKVFNRKELSTAIGHYFGLVNKGYCDTIIRLLNTEDRQEIVNAVSGYLPDEIPRDL